MLGHFDGCAPVKRVLPAKPVLGKVGVQITVSSDLVDHQTAWIGDVARRMGRSGHHGTVVGQSPGSRRTDGALAGSLPPCSIRCWGGGSIGARCGRNRDARSCSIDSRCGLGCPGGTFHTNLSVTAWHGKRDSENGGVDGVGDGPPAHDALTSQSFRCFPPSRGKMCLPIGESAHLMGDQRRYQHDEARPDEP
jgi:hypothetical protein